MLLWQAGGGESGGEYQPQAFPLQIGIRWRVTPPPTGLFSGPLSDGVREVRKRPLRLPDQPLAHVRIHDQLHPQAQASAGEVHDEQRAGELHHPAGEDIGTAPIIDQFLGFLMGICVCVCRL